MYAIIGMEVAMDDQISPIRVGERNLVPSYSPSR